MAKDEIIKLAAATWHENWVFSEDCDLVCDEFESARWGTEWAAAFAAGHAWKGTDVTRNVEHTIPHGEYGTCSACESTQDAHKRGDE